MKKINYHKEALGMVENLFDMNLVELRGLILKIAQNNPSVFVRALDEEYMFTAAYQVLKRHIPIESVNVSKKEIEHMFNEAKNGRKMLAIKGAREIFKIGLKEAKELIDEIMPLV